MTIPRVILTDDQLIALWPKHKSAQKIATATGSSYWLVRPAAKRLGLSKTRQPFDEDKLRALWREGLTIRAIATSMGTNINTVDRRAWLLGLPRRGRDWKHSPTTEAQTPPAQPLQQGPQPQLSLSGHLIATKGKWAALMKLADKHGWTSKQAQQKYHAARAS